jgi:transcriptional regulator with XRE-family HTH domain
MSDLSFLSQLRLFRVKHRISQEEIGKYLGVKQSGYSKYEKGVVGIPLAVLLKLSQFIDEKGEGNSEVAESVRKLIKAMDEMEALIDSAEEVPPTQTIQGIQAPSAARGESGTVVHSGIQPAHITLAASKVLSDPGIRDIPPGDKAELIAILAEFLSMGIQLRSALEKALHTVKSDQEPRQAG